MRLKRVVLLLCLIGTFAWLGSETQDARACSGPPDTFQQHYERHKIFAAGHVIETDDLGQNVIVRVERYFKGTGPENLLFVRRNIKDIYGMLTAYVDCTSWKTPLFINDKIYFSASRRADGSYASANYFENADYRYNSPDEINNVYSDISDPQYDLGEPVPHNEQQFLALVAKTSNAPPNDPDKNTSIPLASPLLIATAKSLYIVPVDNKLPVKLEKVAESAIPNFYSGADNYIIYIDGERCLTFNCQAVEPLTEFPLYKDYVKTDYNAALLAPQGGLAALWADKELIIRTFKFVCCVPNRTILLNEDVKATALKLAQYAQWSPDGKRIAYSDIKGLWVWNVYDEQDNPTLVRPITSKGTIPIARYFSPRGRYLAITEGKTQSTLDLETNDVFPDGFVSPDDRLLIAIVGHSDQPELLEIGLCKLDLGQCDNPAILPHGFDKVEQIEWTSSKTILALVAAQQTDNGFGTQISIVDSSAGYILRDAVADFSNFLSIEYPPSIEVTPLNKGFAFAFDRANKTLAVIKDKSTLVINKREYDIGRYLDGDIVSIRWLPSLLYREPR